eukprot:scaffold82570_cov21-Tisochrysis_lutea.AAC.1
MLKSTPSHPRSVVREHAACGANNTILPTSLVSTDAKTVVRHLLPSFGHSHDLRWPAAKGTD